MSHPRPRIVISRCIDFDACRYDGQVIRASLREELEPHVDFVPICPELEIGLGVPRDPVRLVRRSGATRMEQPATGRDLTAPDGGFSRDFLSGLGAADAFILKAARRPAGCATRRSSTPTTTAPRHDSGPGLFAARVLERFPHAAVEDEGAAERPAPARPLPHEAVRARRRSRCRGRGPAGPVDFHARNKLLLMAHSEALMRRLGRLRGAGRHGAARRRRTNTGAVSAPPSRSPCAARPERQRADARSRARVGPPRPRRADPLPRPARELPPPHRAAQRTPGRAGVWAARFEVPYLAGQTFLEPYPPQLARFERVTKRQRRSLREVPGSGPLTAAGNCGYLHVHHRLREGG